MPYIYAHVLSRDFERLNDISSSPQYSIAGNVETNNWNFSRFAAIFMFIFLDFYSSKIRHHRHRLASS